MKINPKIDISKLMKDTQGTVSMQPNGLPDVTEYGKALQEMFSAAEINKLTGMNSHFAVAAYGSIYTKVSQQLQGIIKAVDSMRGFYLVDVILSQISEDALSPKVGSDKIIKFSYPNDIIQKELDELHKRIGLDQLIENIAPDILAYGEYTLATVIGKPPEEKTSTIGPKKGKKFKSKKSGDGILDVTDIVDQGTVISLTQDGNVEGYLVTDEATGRLEIKETADYIKFSLGGQRIRVNMKQDLPTIARANPRLKEIFDKIPRFIRIGKSVLYPVLEKLKELQLLEKLIPATKINKLSQGNLVGMNVPESFDLETAQMAVKKIEGMINKKVAVDPNTSEITVESILSTAGKTKILPIFGDKGSLQNMDYKAEEADSLMGDTKEIRELILDSVGVPSELVYKSDGDSKADILKRHAKYVRKLKRLQKSIVQGAKQIGFIHLANKGISFKKEELEVVFNNTLVEIDNLDSLEHADVTVGLLANVRDFFNDMADEDSPYRDNINLNKVTEYLEENLKAIGLADAMVLQKEGGGDVDKTADEIGDVSPNVTAEPKEEPVDDVEDDGVELEKTKGDGNEPSE